MLLYFRQMTIYYLFIKLLKSVSKNSNFKANNQIKNEFL